MPTVRNPFLDQPERVIKVPVGVQVEEFPETTDGSIQVGEGCGPRETVVFEEKIIPAKKGFNIHDLVNVQPMMEEHGVTFALRSKVSLDSDKQVAKRGHAPGSLHKAQVRRKR